MCGQNKVICIAGKNLCAIDALKYVVKKIKKYKILALPNKMIMAKIVGKNLLKNIAINNKIEITKLNNLYKIKNLFFFSLEFESILKVKNLNQKIYLIFIFSLTAKI